MESLMESRALERKTFGNKLWIDKHLLSHSCMACTDNVNQLSTQSTIPFILLFYIFKSMRALILITNLIQRWRRMCRCHMGS